jgi:hypothetical protein
LYRKLYSFQVGLQVATANRLLNPDSKFDQRPESFDGVRMHIAHYVDLLPVIDPAMVVFVDVPVQVIVRNEVIGKHCAWEERALLPGQALSVPSGWQKNRSRR